MIGETSIFADRIPHTPCWFECSLFCRSHGCFPGIVGWICSPYPLMWQWNITHLWFPEGKKLIQFRWGWLLCVPVVGLVVPGFLALGMPIWSHLMLDWKLCGGMWRNTTRQIPHVALGITHTHTHTRTYARTHARTHAQHTHSDLSLSLSAYKFLCVDIYIYSMYDWYNIYIICIYIICTRNPLISCLYLSTPLPPCHPWYLGWSINPDVWGSLNGVINDHQAANGLVVV